MYWGRVILFFGLGISLAFGSVKKAEQNSINPMFYTDLFDSFYLAQSGNIKQAVDSFYSLYKKTNDVIYLKYAISYALNSDIDKNKINDMIKQAKSYKNLSPDFKRLEIGYYINIQDLDKASLLASDLIKQEPTNDRNYVISAMLYSSKQDYQKGLEMIKKAYELDETEQNLLFYLDLLSTKFNDKNEVVAVAKKWLEHNICTQKVCFGLANVYLALKQFDSAAKTLVELYEAVGDDENINQAVQIYLYYKKIDEAAALLEKYGTNNELLLEIYTQQKQYKKGYELAKNLYQETKNKEFMVKMAILQILQYQSSGKKASKQELDKIIKLFDESEINDNPLYLNGYGYILIDNDIDVKKGLKLIQAAYAIMPDSPFIIDSMAWGYFKLGDCKSAKEWLSKIKEPIKENDMKEHLRAINKCLFKQKIKK